MSTKDDYKEMTVEFKSLGEVSFPAYREMTEMVRFLLNLAIEKANKEKGLKRADIARSLSKKTKTSITEHMINKWTRTDFNHFPLTYSIYICEICDDFRLFKYLLDVIGQQFRTEKEKVQIELWELREKEADLAERRYVLERQLKGK